MPLDNAHHFVMESATLTEIGIQINNSNIVQHRKSLSPVMKMPPSTSQNFTGQEEYLAKLQTHFHVNDCSSRKMYLLYGMGGIGKTQICLKFKDDICDNYAHIFWIDATSDDTIDQSLKDIYKTNSECMPQGITFSSALVLQWISVTEVKWMIIYDNADGSPNVVQKFLTPGNKGHILISSRNPENKSVVSARNSVEVNVMDRNTATELLIKSSGLHDQAEKYLYSASEICSKLHFLPLAIDQAGAYINAGRCSIDKYISIYDKYSSKLMDNKSFRGASKYDKTVYGTWEISFQKIQDMVDDKRNEEQVMAAQYAIALLNMCTFMHHENISDEIFERAARHFHGHVLDNEELPLPTYIPTMDMGILNFDYTSEWNKMQYCESIGILLSFSLIKRTIDGTKFGLHPLVQKWCQDRLSPKEKKKWIQNSRGLLLSSITKDKTIQEYILLNALILHITQNLSHENIDNMAYYHDIFQLLEHVLYVNGKYSMHHSISKRICQKSREIYGDDHVNTLSSKSTLAISHSKLGNFSEANSLHEQILKMRCRILGIEHPETLTSMAALVETYYQLGKYTEAESLGVQSFDMRCRILGTEDPDTLVSMEYLAYSYCSLEKYNEAEKLELHVLEMRKRILSTEHPDTLRGMACLAATYHLVGKYADAERLEVQVLEMRMRILGTEHPDTLLSMANMACTYRELGKYADAERLEVQVLETRKRILGTKHPSTLESMANLAVTYYEVGKYSEAEKLEAQVLEARKIILGLEHPDTLSSMENLAFTYGDLGKYSEAERLEVQVLEMRNRILGTDHADTLRGMANLALTYYQVGKYSEAERLQVHVLEMRGRILGAEHPDTLLTVKYLTNTYKSMGKHIEAAELEMQLADIKNRTESRG